MKPDDQRGYIQPNPTPATRPLNPAQSVHPVQPIQPAARVAPALTNEAVQAALNESPSPAVAAPPVALAPTPVAVQPLAPAPQAAPEQQPIYQQYTEDEQDDGQLSDDEDAITWTAQEYLHQEKGTKWFVVFGVVVAVLLALAIFFMKSWTFAVLLGVISVGVVVYSRRPPRELTYGLNDDGLTVDGVLHEFSKFKSFGVIRDGEEYSVMLIPTQRFQPGLTVYFPEEAGEDIVDILGSYLPMKELHLDAVDRVIRLIRL